MAKVISETALVEVASVPCGLPWLDRVKAKVVENWKGEPAVSEKDAAKATDAYEKDLAEHEERQTRYQACVRQREVDRAAAGNAAVEEARPLLMARQLGAAQADNTIWVGNSYQIAATQPTARVRSALIQIRRQAVQRFDEEHPEVPLEEFN